jgi:acetoin utilization deacetylase AcuC-like enzyme
VAIAPVAGAVELAVLVLSGPVGMDGHARDDHPERPARMRAVMSGIEDLRLGDDLVVVPTRPADQPELARVHAAAFLDQLSAFSRAGGGDLDPDTYATAESWSIALRAAGAGLAAIEELRRRGDGAAFVAVRPPGHHALTDRAMGFCLLNNVAVSAAALAAQSERVLVVDWDVHHGNGTQAIFWDVPDVLYVSTHQWPAFPGTGRAAEVGGVRALDATVNIPLPPGATGDVVRRAVDEIARPVIERFEPTWVLVSAGFDAHRDDPLADLALSSGDYAALARMVAAFAPRPGRLALFLEGGYDLPALRRSVAATIGALEGGWYEPEEPTSGGPGADLLEAVRIRRVGALVEARRAAEEGC